MNQTTNKNALLISADTDPQKFIQSMRKIRKPLRIASIIGIIGGTIFAIVGFSMIEELTPYSRDIDVLSAFLAFALGVLSVLSGLFAPSLLKKTLARTAQRQKMDVYEDHIEGHATQISGTTQIQINFYETYDKISSVSTTETHISVNMKDGGIVRCVALNAQDIAETIRAKLV